MSDQAMEDIQGTIQLSQREPSFLEQIASQEIKDEKTQLKELRKQREEMAKKLRAEEDSQFNQEKEKIQSERLQYLLKTAEDFTSFILSKDSAGNTGNKKMAFIDGKTSVSRRRNQTKSKHIDDEELEEEKRTTTRLVVQPSILANNCELKKYQLDALNWMINLFESGISGILADEMGLGKTIQSISLLAFLREFKDLKRYHIVVAPKSVIPNWINEFKKWCPAIKVVNLIPTKDERERILRDELVRDQFDVCITTYEGMRICLPQLKKFKWTYIIVDEAHKLKNEQSQVSRKIRELDSKYRLLLTGTPLQNNLHELWAILNFLLPEIFSSAQDFDEWFDLSKATGTKEEVELKNQEIISQLHKILKPFMLRRIKKEVEKSIPPKVEFHLSVGLTEMQKDIYRKLLSKGAIDQGNSIQHYKNMLMQLRKVCNHPYLFEGVEDKSLDEFGEHLIENGGKMIVLDKLLKKFKTDGNQVLIFSQFTSMLDILEDYCFLRQYNYCRLDGNTTLDNRESQIDLFTMDNSDKFVFLISTRAGGLGLNLMSANIVILFDSDWNPQADLQAMDRCHRIGQTKVVKVFRLVTENTMEEIIVQRQAMKLKLDSVIIQKGRLAPKQNQFSKDDLEQMVNYGANEIFKTGSNVTDEDIEHIIQKGEEKAYQLLQKAQEKAEGQMDLANFEINQGNIWEFEERDWKKERENMKFHVVNMLDEEVRRGRTMKKVANNNLNESRMFPRINVGSLPKKKKLKDYKFYLQREVLQDLMEREFQAKYHNGQELTQDEQDLKLDLLSSGFDNWEHRDYQKFVQALEFCEKNQYSEIAKYIETKTPQEIEVYAIVFFERMTELSECQRIERVLDKAKKTIQFRNLAPLLLERKVCAYVNPYEEMQINFAQKSKYFSRESDVVLLVMAHKYGYGNWAAIKKSLRKDPKCRFDHILLSRTEDEVRRRVDLLLKNLEKEEISQQKRREKEGDEEMKVQSDSEKKGKKRSKKQFTDSEDIEVEVVKRQRFEQTNEEN